MKTILFTLFLLVHISIFYGQESKKSDYRYTKLEAMVDSLIEDSLFQSIFNLSKTEFKDHLRNRESLTIISDTLFSKFVSGLLSKEYSIVTDLRNLISREILETRYFKDSIGENDYINRIQDLNGKLEIVDEYIKTVVSADYIHYDFPEISKKWIKGFHFYHDNDVFLFSKKNQDRDYTGGFRFELMTDQFKMRMFKNLGYSNHFLSYQSIFIGGEGYTPYIRFTEDELRERGVFYEIDNKTKFFTEASLDSIEEYMRTNQQLSDRPFASFQYIGRAKYRLHNDGWIRSRSLFKLGIIGKNLGKNIQAVIHKDITTGSQRVLNWSDQIAHGGRLAVNVEHKIDLSLFSSHTIRTSNKEYKNDFVKSLAANMNIYLPFEVAFGTVQTHVGSGIGISNKSFIDISGINDPKYHETYGHYFFRDLWLNSYLSFEYNYRYVVHNSMLEGVGFYKPFNDDPLDDESVTTYRLNKESVQRHLHKIQFHIGYRVRKATIYYKQVRFINREFKVNASPNYTEFTTPRWYGYGSIGLNFML